MVGVWSQARSVECADAIPRDTPPLHRVLRDPRSRAAAQRFTGAARLGYLRADHHRGHAAAQAVLPGHRGASGGACGHGAEVLSHRRHRPGWKDGSTPHVLRDARQLFVRRLLQGVRDRLRLGAVDQPRRVRLRPVQAVGVGVRGRCHRPRGRGGDRAVAANRPTGRPDRAAGRR